MRADNRKKAYAWQVAIIFLSKSFVGIYIGFRKEYNLTALLIFQSPLADKKCSKNGIRLKTFAPLTTLRVRSISSPAELTALCAHIGQKSLRCEICKWMVGARK